MTDRESAGAGNGWLRATRRLWMDPPSHPADVAAFDVYLEQLSAVWTARFALSIAALTLLWWPIDWLVLGPESRLYSVFSAWRLRFVPLCVFGWWMARRAHRWPVSVRTLGAAMSVPMVAVTFDAFGGLGGPELPWFHAAFLVPPLTVILLLAPAPRLLLNATLAGVALWSLERGRPAFHEYEYRAGWVMLLAMSVVYATGAGHALRELVRRNFLQARTLERLATADPLTEVHNRRSFFELAASEVDRARRHGRPLGVLMVDVDDFKSVNDAAGHAAGDAALVCVARTLERQLRAHDSIARLGGEEFGVLLAQAGIAEARTVAERMRAAIEAGVSAGTGAGLRRVTVSVGCSELEAGDEGIEGPLGRADRCLYAAKRAGRNRVVSEG